MEIYVVGTIAVLLGGFLQGCLGFGFGLISVPPLLMVLAAAEVVPMQIALSVFLSLPLAWKERRQIQPLLVGPLIIGAVIGLPVGMFVLQHFDGPLLKIVIGTLLVVMSFTMLTGWSYPIRRQLLALFPIGFLSGIMATSFSMAGPPIILFLTNQSMDKNQFRANILIYFAVLGVVATTGYASSGAYSQSIIMLISIFVPAVLLGGFAGARVSSRVPQATFRRLTLLAALIMGSLLIIRNLGLLIS